MAFKSLQDYYDQALKDRSAATTASAPSPAPKPTAPTIGDWIGNDAPEMGTDLDSMYQSILGRNVGQEGIDFYQPKLDSGEISMDEMYKILMASPERQYGMDEQNSWLDDIYQQELGRPAFREGEEFYNNMDPAEAARQIRASAEAEAYRNSGKAQDLVLGEEGEWPAYTESGWDLSPDDPWGYDNPYTKPAADGVIDGLINGGDGPGGKPGTGAGVGGWGGYAGNAGTNFKPGGGTSLGSPGDYDRTQTSGDMSNDELYAAQFGNLLKQQNSFQNQQQAANAIRAEKEAAGPSEANADPWDWYNNVRGGKGLPQLNIADQNRDAEGNPTNGTGTWDFAPGITSGMTNSQLFGVLSPQLSEANRAMLQKGFGGAGGIDPTTGKDTSGDGALVQWASGQSMDPAYWKAQRDPNTSTEYGGALDELIGLAFNRRDLTTQPGGGPSAAPGYASPISGGAPLQQGA